MCNDYESEIIQGLIMLHLRLEKFISPLPVIDCDHECTYIFNKFYIYETRSSSIYSLPKKSIYRGFVMEIFSLRASIDRIRHVEAKVVKNPFEEPWHLTLDVFGRGGGGEEDFSKLEVDWPKRRVDISARARDPIERDLLSRINRRTRPVRTAF